MFKLSPRILTLNDFDWIKQKFKATKTVCFSFAQFNLILCKVVLKVASNVALWQSAYDFQLVMYVSVAGLGSWVVNATDLHAGDTALVAACWDLCESVVASERMSSHGCYTAPEKNPTLHISSQTS